MWRLWLGSFCLATAPIFVKLLELPPTAIGVYRCGLGALLLWAIVLFSPRRSPGPARYLIAAGLFFAGDLYLWHRSVILAGAGLSTIFANTQVFYVSLYGILFHGERPGRRFAVSVVLAMAGVILLTGRSVGQPIDADFLAGILFGLGTGVMYAGYILTLRAAEARGPRSNALLNLASVTTVSAVALFLICAVEGTLRLPTARDWACVIGLAAVPQVIGWLLITSTLMRVPASRAGLILLCQPALATLLGAFLLQEYLTLRQIAGAVMTLVAIYLGTAPRPAPQSTPPALEPIVDVKGELGCDPGGAPRQV